MLSFVWAWNGQCGMMKMLWKHIVTRCKVYRCFCINKKLFIVCLVIATISFKHILSWKMSENNSKRKVLTSRLAFALNSSLCTYFSAQNSGVKRSARKNRLNCKVSEWSYGQIYDWEGKLCFRLFWISLGVHPYRQHIGAGHCYACEEEMWWNFNRDLALCGWSKFRLFNHARHEVCAVFADRPNAHSFVQIVGVSNFVGHWCIHEIAYK